MDGYDGYVTNLDFFESTIHPPIPGNPTSFIESSTVTLFIMRATDANASGTVYRSWSSYNKPDFSASKYNGPYSGASINFIDIVVATQIKLI